MKKQALLMAILATGAACSSGSKVYTAPLWSWRTIGVAAQTFAISPDLNIEVPASRSVYRTSYTDEPLYPTLYFFMSPKDGRLVDGSRWERYSDTAQVTFNFNKDLDSAAQAREISIADAGGAYQDRDKASKGIGSQVGRGFAGGRAYFYRCQSLITDHNNTLPIECTAIAVGRIKGSIELDTAVMRGSIPRDRLDPLFGMVSKIEASFKVPD